MMASDDEPIGVGLRVPPIPDEDTRVFWTNGKSGRLMIHRCRSCRRWFHPPSPVCPHCDAVDVAPEAVSGDGIIHTFTINHQAWTPDMSPPFVIAVVALEEDPDVRLTTNVVGCPASAVRVGMQVRVAFEEVPGAGVWLPLFRPVKSP